MSATRRSAVPGAWFVLADPEFNAAAFGDMMMITSFTLEDPGLTAVIAHELGHLNTTDCQLTVAVARLSTPARLLIPVRNAMIESGGSLLAPLAALVGLGSGHALLRLVGPLWDAWWRTREYKADEYAARLGLADELASALERNALENDRPTPFQFISGATHPYTEHRIDALSSTPAATPTRRHDHRGRDPERARRHRRRRHRADRPRQATAPARAPPCPYAPAAATSEAVPNRQGPIRQQDRRGPRRAPVPDPAAARLRPAPPTQLPLPSLRQLAHDLAAPARRVVAVGTRGRDREHATACALLSGAAPGTIGSRRTASGR
ncbi:MAG TPA: M48 family metalloprotease [Solirubrobacteraceae bacterium]